jgi:photosystem II stability/assembly factor-like uncharacterized protein
MFLNRTAVILTNFLKLRGGKDMSLKKPCVTLFFFSILFFAVSCTVVGNGGWRLIRETRIDFWRTSYSSPAVAVAGYLDENAAFAVSQPYHVFQSRDGGAWQRIDPTPDSASMLFCSILEITDAHTLRLRGGFQTLASDDGGKHWRELPRIGDMYTPNIALSFADPQNGWLGTKERLLATHDGGRTWTEVALPPGAKDHLLAADLAPDGVGFLLLDSGDLLGAESGGSGWTVRRLPLEKRTINTDIYWSGSSAVRFRDARQGTVIVTLAAPKPGFVIFSTVDGGTTWREERLPAIGTDGDPVGTVFLSRDGRFLTVNDIVARKIYLFQKAGG